MINNKTICTAMLADRLTAEGISHDMHARGMGIGSADRERVKILAAEVNATFRHHVQPYIDQLNDVKALAAQMQYRLGIVSE